MDKLANVEFEEGVTGCPLLTEHVLSVLEAEVFEQIDLGSHTIFVGDVVNAEVLKAFNLAENGNLMVDFGQEHVSFCP